MLERRRSFRLCYATSARVETNLGAWEGRVRDISPEGMFMTAPQQLTRGERLQVGFRLRHSGQTFDLDGEVRRG